MSRPLACLVEVTRVLAEVGLAASTSMPMHARFTAIQLALKLLRGLTVRDRPIVVPHSPPLVAVILLSRRRIEQKARGSHLRTAPFRLINIWDLIS